MPLDTSLDVVCLVSWALVSYVLALCVMQARMRARVQTLEAELGKARGREVVHERVKTILREEALKAIAQRTAIEAERTRLIAGHRIEKSGCEYHYQRVLKAEGEAVKNNRELRFVNEGLTQHVRALKDQNEELTMSNQRLTFKTQLLSHDNAVLVRQFSHLAVEKQELQAQYDSDWGILMQENKVLEARLEKVLGQWEFVGGMLMAENKALEARLEKVLRCWEVVSGADVAFGLTGSKRLRSLFDAGGAGGGAGFE